MIPVGRRDAERNCLGTFGQRGRSGRQIGRVLVGRVPDALGDAIGAFRVSADLGDRVRKGENLTVLRGASDSLARSLSSSASTDNNSDSSEEESEARSDEIQGKRSSTGELWWAGTSSVIDTSLMSPLSRNWKGMMLGGTCFACYLLPTQQPSLT